jgi:hypothetical protein
VYSGPEGILIESAETPGLFLEYLPENDITPEENSDAGAQPTLPSLVLAK